LGGSIGEVKRGERGERGRKVKGDSVTIYNRLTGL
jgi:hypothetical protein